MLDYLVKEVDRKNTYYSFSDLNRCGGGSFLTKVALKLLLSHSREISSVRYKITELVLVKDLL